MKALNPLLILVAVVITSCYFFPFVLAAFPVANSKMILASVGLVMLGVSLVRNGNGNVDYDFVKLSIWAFGISLVAYTSMNLNNTPDNTFATYFMSMWVWLGGAYAVVSVIKLVHGGISVPLTVNYLLAVCVGQCVLALVFDNVPSAAEWCDSTFTGEGYMGNTEDDRLHGIGCSLDVAGFRFASVICMAAFLLCHDHSRRYGWTSALYIFAICFISVVGNMLSRSTIVGTAIAMAYVFCIGIVRYGNRRLLSQLTFFVVVALVLCVYFYNVDAGFRANIRFGFEGFFSLAEKGEWRTHSNDILKNMVVWPENFKTWLIGDGYFDNPSVANTESFDPYYVGQYFGGYYMGTDIGYLRYIFYFGLIGLAAFSIFFIQVCNVCMKRFPMFKWMFLMILAINFIQWFKVSTDLFVVFAPFLCISARENEDYISRDSVPSFR